MSSYLKTDGTTLKLVDSKKRKTLKELVIPTEITEIGQLALRGCTVLESLTIPASIIHIDYNPFEDCDNLQRVNICDLSAWCKIRFDGWLSNPLYKAQYLTLNGEDVVELNIPSEIEKIGDHSFTYYNALEMVVIPEGVAEIGEAAFRHCESVDNLTIGDSVAKIGKDAFADCKSLQTVKLPKGLTKIEGSVFCRCTQLTDVVIPDTITEIGTFAFYMCKSLTSITIPASVTVIKEGAFGDCTSLTSVIIPTGVTTIKDKVFLGCTNLTSVYIKAETPTALGEHVFSYKPTPLSYEPLDCKIYVPNNSVEAYKTAHRWEIYKDNIVGYDF